MKTQSRGKLPVLKLWNSNVYINLKVSARVTGKSVAVVLGVFFVYLKQSILS